MNICKHCGAIFEPDGISRVKCKKCRAEFNCNKTEYIINTCIACGKLLTTTTKQCAIYHTECKEKAQEIYRARVRAAEAARRKERRGST